MAHKFDPDKMALLDDPGRGAWQNVDAFLSFLQLRPNAVVADLGAGTGYFTIPLAQQLKGTGTVYALDTEPRMLERLKERCAQADLSGWVIPMLSEESTLPLPDNSVDLFLMANVFHELESPEKVGAELARVLADGGNLVVTDWAPQDTIDEVLDVGPRLHHRVKADEVQETLEQQGFRYILSWNGFSQHYTLVFENSTSNTSS